MQKRRERIIVVQAEALFTFWKNSLYLAMTPDGRMQLDARELISSPAVWTSALTTWIPLWVLSLSVQAKLSIPLRVLQRHDATIPCVKMTGAEFDDM